MASVALGNPRAIAGSIRVLFDAGTFRDLTDGQLLERFATARGEVGELAFAALVERHGPMVLRVCRGILPDPDDSRDAFQATFLVLVEKARGLWVRDSLGPWLHQVAYRTAKCARASAARRRRLERTLPIPESVPHPADDLGPVLHEEIERLPERYRVPIVLCDLQGRTHEQAARHLGWPVGTVKSRQSRGRERLRQRLTRRGVAPEAGTILLAMRPGLLGTTVPPVLAEVTTRMATRSLAPGGLTSGLPAASLALEVVKAMAMTRWWKLAALVIVAGATASGVPLLARQDAPRDGAAQASKKAGPDDAPTTTVKPGPLRSSVVERGNLEASRTSDIASQVTGQTTIISLLPEGTEVRKGDLIAELDSSAVKDDLASQEIATRRAKADVDNAERARIIAEIDVKKYAEGTSKLEQVALEAEIRAHEASIGKAKARLERTRDAQARLNKAIGKNNDPSPLEIIAEVDMADRVERAEDFLALHETGRDLARSKLDQFQRFTRGNVLMGLEADALKAQSVELGARADFERAKGKGVRLEKMILMCKIYAPTDGVVVYNIPNARPGSAMLEEGSTVRERQKLFSIPDYSSPLRLNVKVREAIIDRLNPGQTVRVAVDALPDEALTGVVKSVQGFPDQPVPSSGVKFYTTLVELKDAPKSLRPGMTAQAEILIGKADDALLVPISAVVAYDGKWRVAVKADGGHEWREVTTGQYDGKTGGDGHHWESVEIKSGLKPGETVFNDPLSLMTEEEKREKLPPKGKAAPRSAPGKSSRR